MRIENKNGKNYYDKKALKKKILKYAIMLLCIAPFIVILDLTAFSQMSSTLRIVLNVVIILALVFIIDGIIASIKSRKQEDTKENKK